MTIIVGIISDEGIILASDSQTTSGTAKRCDANKISLVEFKNLKVLVAQAGYATFSGRALEIFEAAAKDKEITDYRMIVEMAEKAMRQMKDEARFQQGDCTMEELRDFVWKHELEAKFMLAYYFEGNPFLFTLDMVVGVANKVNSHYDAIGCGANLGGYLLSELSYTKMDSGLAAAIAVHVVESVKNHDAYCGGETKAAILKDPNNNHPSFRIFTKEEVGVLVKIVSEMDNKTKKQRNKIIQKALLKPATDYFKSIKMPVRRYDVPSKIKMPIRKAQPSAIEKALQDSSK